MFPIQTTLRCLHFPGPVQRARRNRRARHTGDQSKNYKTHAGGLGDGTSWGYSPSMAFALNLLSHNPRQRIAIINCAMGSTSISQWQRGGELYEKCISIATSQHKGIIRGIVFIQGESDTATPEAARAWGKQFAQFAHDFRADIGRPNVKIILPLLGTIPPYNQHLGWDLLSSLQPEFARKTGNVRTVETIDLTKPDGYHYDRAGVDILGQRCADAIK